MSSRVYFLSLFWGATGEVLRPLPLWRWPNSASSYSNSAVPNSSENAYYNKRSGCAGGGDNPIVWHCPHLMLLSPDMQYAAEADNNSWAVYAAVSIGSQTDCGACFQLEITSDSSASPNKYIVQAINTGSDINSGQFNILVGAGGLGYFTACSSDCRYGRVCDGGQCNSPLYSGNFAAWTPDGNCYGGGVHSTDGCDNLVTTNSRTFGDNTLLYGCKTAINRGYHNNFQVQWEKVRCPESLYKVTGIRRTDDMQYPAPQPGMTLRMTGNATTTMNCCKPSCAWRQNVTDIADAKFPQVYSCDGRGLPATADARRWRLAGKQTASKFDISSYIIVNYDLFKVMHYI